MSVGRMEGEGSRSGLGWSGGVGALTEAACRHYWEKDEVVAGNGYGVSWGQALTDFGRDAWRCEMSSSRSCSGQWEK